MTIIYEAKGFWARSYGWHRFARQHPQHLLFLPRCQAVHSMSLPMPIWLLFVDNKGGALGEWRRLKPNRFCWYKGAYGVLETAIKSHEKRRQIEVTLLASGWLAQTTPWEVDCFGQKYYGK